MKNFSVTYMIVTPESAKDGDFAETGFIVKDVTLREALSEFQNFGYIEASCSPYTPSPHVWFTAQGEQDYRDGSQESRSLHCPNSITPSSHRRIAKLLGLIH